MVKVVVRAWLDLASQTDLSLPSAEYRRVTPNRRRQPAGAYVTWSDGELDADVFAGNDHDESGEDHDSEH